MKIERPPVWARTRWSTTCDLQKKKKNKVTDETKIRTHKRVDVRPLCRSYVSGHTGGSVVGTGVASPARASREARISLADADPA